MATRIAKINCNGRIHDDDSSDPFGSDEEESYSWSKNIAFEVGGFSKTYEESKTVDGEVQLKMKLDLQIDSNNILTVSGNLELWEGPSWNLGASQAIDSTNISPGETKTLYNNRLADNEGDWADVKLEVQNAG